MLFTSNEGAIDSQIPVRYGQLAGTQYDWQFNTVPQTGLGGRTVPFTQGRILGGTSSISEHLPTCSRRHAYLTLSVQTGCFTLVVLHLTTTNGRI